MQVKWKFECVDTIIHDIGTTGKKGIWVDEGNQHKVGRNHCLAPFYPASMADMIVFSCDGP